VASPARRGRVALLRPVAALGWGGGGGGIEDVTDLFGRVEAFLYTVADAAVVAAAEGGAKEEAAARAGDWLSGITASMETVLKVRPALLQPLAPPPGPHPARALKLPRSRQPLLRSSGLVRPIQGRFLAIPACA
jgi:hypothetical protein